MYLKMTETNKNHLIKMIDSTGLKMDEFWELCELVTMMKPVNSWVQLCDRHYRQLVCLIHNRWVQNHYKTKEKIVSDKVTIGSPNPYKNSKKGQYLGD